MPKRVDSNQAEIVSALRAAGCTVRCLHEVGHGVPDLLVRRKRTWKLLEVKRPGAKLTPQEVSFLRDWSPFAVVVHSVGEALAAMGLKEALR
jgi:hypothetical protein